MEQADVTIVGGGIAGLSVAEEICSQSSRRVVLVEQEAIGSNKTTPVVFLDAIREFGLEDSILQVYSAFVQHSASGAFNRFDFGKAEMASISYQKACAILYERAIKRGLSLINAKALDMLPLVRDKNRDCVVRLDNGTEIRSELVVDASGCAQWASKLLHIKRSKYYSHCYGECLAGCHIDDPSAFKFLWPARRYGTGGGWWYPIGREKVSVGYSMVIPSSVPHYANARAGYLLAKQAFQPYSDWMKTARVVYAEYGLIPVGRIGRFVADRILIVGDAAGQAHPWVVEGCRPALYNGKKCAQVVLASLAKGRYDKSALASYEKAWKRINRERFFRDASVADIAWSRSDEDWEELLVSLRRLSPAQMLMSMKENYAPPHMRWYALAGHVRRQTAKTIKNCISPRTGRSL